MFVQVSSEVYGELSKIAAGWGQSVHEYTNTSLQKILFAPASRNAFAFAAMVRLQKERYRSTMK
jgi:hypothetical protein